MRLKALVIEGNRNAMEDKTEAYIIIAIYRVMRDEVEECLQILKTCSWVYVDVIVTVCSDYYIRIAFLHFLLPLTSPPLPSDPFSYPPILCPPHIRLHVSCS